MNLQHANRFLISKQYRNNIGLVCLFSLILITIGIDFVYARSQNSSFYFSESLLFSSFWILFIPLLNIQLRTSKRTKNVYCGMAISILLITVHLLVYPAMIWLLSGVFYEHTFPYMQTLRFGFTEYFIKLVILYSVPIPVMVLYNNIYLKNLVSPEKVESISTNFLTSLIVSDIHNQKIVLDTKEIFYFSANSPYINIHHQSKKYLHSETLRSLESRLDTTMFVRIHRSYIVNISKVNSYTSRQNGDYDLMLSDGTKLRLSRNYAAAFKVALENYPRLTI